jgi:hypothetical protein
MRRDVILTVELPDTLFEQFRERQIPEEKMRAVAIAALEIWLAQQHSTDGPALLESAVPFVRRLIAQNRELFEALALR